MRISYTLKDSVAFVSSVRELQCCQHRVVYRVQSSWKSSLYHRLRTLMSIAGKWTIPRLPSSRCGSNPMIERPCLRSAITTSTLLTYAYAWLQAYHHEAVAWRHMRHPNIAPFLGVADIFPVCLVSTWMIHGTVVMFLNEQPDADRFSLVR